MNAELKQKWIDALRSGKYKQGKWRLRDKNNCYCCLGVLTDVCGLGFSDDGLQTLPDFKGKKNGYPSLIELTGSEATINMLVHMNDTKRASFKRIAKYIEQNL